MPETDIKEIVRERYAEIARSVRGTGFVCCYDGEVGSRVRFRPISTPTTKPGRCRKTRCWRRSAAAIRPRSPS